MRAPKLTTSQRKSIAAKRERNADGTFKRIGDAIANKIGPRSFIGTSAASGAVLGAAMGAYDGLKTGSLRKAAYLGATGAVGGSIGGAIGGTIVRAARGWKSNKTVGAYYENLYNKASKIDATAAKYARSQSTSKGDMWDRTANYASKTSAKNKKRANYWGKRK